MPVRKYLVTAARLAKKYPVFAYLILFPVIVGVFRTIIDIFGLEYDDGGIGSVVFLLEYIFISPLLFVSESIYPIFFGGNGNIEGFRAVAAIVFYIVFFILLQIALTYISRKIRRVIKRHKKEPSPK